MFSSTDLSLIYSFELNRILRDWVWKLNFPLCPGSPYAIDFYDAFDWKARPTEITNLYALL